MRTIEDLDREATSLRGELARRTAELAEAGARAQRLTELCDQQNALIKAMVSSEEKNGANESFGKDDGEEEERTAESRKGSI